MNFFQQEVLRRNLWNKARSVRGMDFLVQAASWEKNSLETISNRGGGGLGEGAPKEWQEDAVACGT